MCVLWNSFPGQFRNGLSKLGVPDEVLGFLFKWMVAPEDYPRIPEAKGSIGAIRSEAFFIPLYRLYLTYGGIFRLIFGPKVCFLLLFCFFTLSGKLVSVIRFELCCSPC